MTNELMSLAWVLALSLAMWVPYVLNLIMVRGVVDAVGYPEQPKPLAPWATRMKAAHYNAVENLVVFSALVLALHVAGISTAATVLACKAYFWARAVHLVAYTFAIPWLRTLAFLAGWACMVALLLALLA